MKSPSKPKLNKLKIHKDVFILLFKDIKDAYKAFLTNQRGISKEELDDLMSSRTKLWDAKSKKGEFYFDLFVVKTLDLRGENNKRLPVGQNPLNRRYFYDKIAIKDGIVRIRKRKPPHKPFLQYEGEIPFISFAVTKIEQKIFRLCNPSYSEKTAFQQFMDDKFDDNLLQRKSYEEQSRLTPNFVTYTSTSTQSKLEREHNVKVALQPLLSSKNIQLTSIFHRIKERVFKLKRTIFGLVIIGLLFGIIWKVDFITRFPRTSMLKRPYVPVSEFTLPPMVLVEGGVFTMGSEYGYDNEKPPHSVTVDTFYIAKYEVTQDLWQKIMGSNPSYFGDCNYCPIENVSWNDTQEFLKRLNQLTKQDFRLPTEAEWEYAAQGGNQKGTSNSSSPEVWNKARWYNENAGFKTHPVGQKLGNDLKIHDMMGNVWEWCQDRYTKDYHVENQDVFYPFGPLSHEYHVLRGGSWDDSSGDCWYTSRIRDQLFVDRSNKWGFRLALSQYASSQEN